jgi:hypoxanthine phosphoribosyltransferase
MTQVAGELIGRDDIRRRVHELGRSIAEDYADREPILITILNGGAVFLADLMRALDRPLEIHFMAVSRYGPAPHEPGRVAILLDLEVDIAGRDVVMVEDIVDTGLTLAYLRSVLMARSPASFEVVTLLDRTVRRIAPIAPRYVGFACPDRFVVGYGLDHRGRYRNLPDIMQVDDLARLDAAPGAPFSG